TPPRFRLRSISSRNTRTRSRYRTACEHRPPGRHTQSPVVRHGVGVGRSSDHSPTREADHAPIPDNGVVPRNHWRLAGLLRAVIDFGLIFGPWVLDAGDHP